MSTNLQGDSWSFVTFARIRPYSQTSTSSDRERGPINYRITEGKSEEKNSYQYLELQIPPGADPGLVHNHKSGFIGFTFNEVFDVDTTQDEVFERIEPMVFETFDGINSTVFAYGQTGSGKTYSICGGDDYQERGLIPRTLTIVFQELQYRQEHDTTTSYKCLISFTEIFQESVYDLLDPNKRSQSLDEWSKVQVYESEDGLVLRNINVFEVSTEEEALNLFFMGTTNRSTSSTPMNHASSRSHAIFTILIESEGIRENRIMTKLGKINLVDLAGSERLYKTENSKSMIKEGKSINLSLHYLEQVIISLRDQIKKQSVSEKRQLQRAESTPLPQATHLFPSMIPPPPTSTSFHIPYRNSVLTNILRDSLGGNCKSCFLLTLSISPSSFEETISTLRFGSRCNEIKVNVKANLEIDLTSQLREAMKQIHDLEDEIQAMGNDKKRLLQMVQEKEEVIHHLTAEETRDLTEEEIEISGKIHQMILNHIQSLPTTSPSAAGNGTISGSVGNGSTTLNETGMNSFSLDSDENTNDMKQYFQKEGFRGYRKPILLDVLMRLSTSFYSLTREMKSVNESKNTHRKLFQEQRSFSMDSKYDDDDHQVENQNIPSQRSANLNHLNTPRGDVESPPIDDCLSADSPPNSFAKPLLSREPTTKLGVSKKLKPLLEGTTIISHGHYGQTKLKTLSLSSDGKEITWRELMKEKEGKTFRLSDCEVFHVIESKHGKVHGGVRVSFVDGTKKTHEFEFPPGTCTPEENIVRVRKWVDLLNDLRVGKMTVIFDSGTIKSLLNSQMRATQMSTSARQISFNSDVETTEK